MSIRADKFIKLERSRLVKLLILIGRAVRRCKCGAGDELEAHSIALLADWE